MKEIKWFLTPAVFFFWAGILVGAPPAVRAECPPLEIEYESNQMSLQETQTLAVQGGVGPFSWAILDGGGALSSPSEASITYSAPDSNPDCAQNPTIQVTDSCGQTAIVRMAVNSYAGRNWDDSAYLVSWCDGPFCQCYPDVWPEYGGGFSLGTNAGLTAYFCDGTVNGSSFGGSRGCNGCAAWCAGEACGCACPAECDTCAGRFAAGDGECGEFTGPGQMKDKRTPAMIAAGCCPAQLLSPCQVKIQQWGADSPLLNLTTGKGISLTGQLSGPGTPQWKIQVAGRTIIGSGTQAAGYWDGKDDSGKQVASGMYLAQLEARAESGRCRSADVKTIPIRVQATPERCDLYQDFGSWANLASGNLRHSQILFQVPYSSLMGRFLLTYNSLGAQKKELGAGWTHSFHIQLTRNNDDSYTLQEGDGSRTSLFLHGGRYQPAYAPFPVLSWLENGGIFAEYKDGTRLSFHAGGSLEGIMDRNENKLAFIYDLRNDLVGLEDPSGRKVSLAYDSQGRIQTIADPNGNTHRFLYEGDHLTQIESEIRGWGSGGGPTGTTRRVSSSPKPTPGGSPLPMNTMPITG